MSTRMGKAVILKKMSVEFEITLAKAVGGEKSGGAKNTRDKGTVEGQENARSEPLQPKRGPKIQCLRSVTQKQGKDSMSGARLQREEGRSGKRKE